MNMCVLEICMVMSCLITEMQMYWFMTIDVLGGATETQSAIGQGHPTKGVGRWFPPPSSVTLVSEVNLLRRIYCCVIWNAKLSRMLYKYYKESIIILYWMLIVTNSCMSITKDLSLHYTEC
jgi:hypothetical protein